MQDLLRKNGYHSVTILYNSVVDGEVAERRKKLQTNSSSFSMWHFISFEDLYGYLLILPIGHNVLLVYCTVFHLHYYPYFILFYGGVIYFPICKIQFCCCCYVHVVWPPEINSWTIEMEFAYSIFKKISWFMY